ncbi:MAG: hypothetical protein GYA43_05680 [Bacteroidales bacterium]|nr:hypothetical protein [Bacteroidales bacterium]
MKEQYLLIARDGKDAGAEERRLNVRPRHLDKIRELKRSGEFLFGGAILDESGIMRGSMILYEVSDRARLDEILKDEPYISGGVWKDIEIVPFRLAKTDF